MDESSFCNADCSDSVYSPIGQTPLIARKTSVTERVYAVSGVSPRGELIRKVHTTPMDSKKIIDFLKAAIKRFVPNPMAGQERLSIVWDNASIHCSKEIKSYLRNDPEAKRVLRLYQTPVYCPWYNPDEQVWNFLKSEFVKYRWCNGIKELANLVRKGLDELGKRPQRIRAAFRHPEVGLF